jgi:three-Cys-motif partner protein
VSRILHNDGEVMPQQACFRKGSLGTPSERWQRTSLAPKIHFLPTAVRSPWTGPVAHSDGLPIRDSGPWIDDKHRLLNYYGDIFARGMKNKWPVRVYYELFSGPGRCLIRDSNHEAEGSPLQVLKHEFTRFIFTEMNVALAEALRDRLAGHPKAHLCEIWCGDCSEAIDKVSIPRGALTFTFIDPTGIGHAPFSLIERMNRKTRFDLLINIQHGMGIKMNMHQYHPDADEQSALTKFLGNEEWKKLPTDNPRNFFLGVLDLYKQRLGSLGFVAGGREVLIFASKSPRAQDFWDKSLKGVLPPELSLW